uniref:Uncharacterized protein n=1 Tax=viral metagenome TaxID=1070528 RepID=A0A6M3L947_9ZZZZ
MNTRRFSFSALIAIVCLISWLAPVLFAGTITEPTTFRDRVVFRGSTGPDFDADNKFSIGGVAVTATAAQLNSAAIPASGMTTASLTNGAVLTLDAATPNVVLTAVGTADAPTNTFTINPYYPVGTTFRLIADSANTNGLLVADSTTVLSLGSDLILGATDSLMLFTVATNKASKLSSSDN